jgi:RHS repeat-associated protein
MICTHSWFLLATRHSPLSSLTFKPANLLTLLVLLLLAPAASAQVATATPPFGSFAGGPDIINVGNNNAHWSFPILNKPGRGTNFFYQLAYDSSAWFPSGGTWLPVTNWGWGAQTNPTLSYIGVQQSHGSCTDPSNPGQQIYDIYIFSRYLDRYGNSHPANLRVDDKNIVTSCTPDQNETASRVLTDGSGLTAYVDDSPYAYVVNPDGTTDYPTFFGSPSSATDRNGNVINVNGSGQFFDTLSSAIPVLSVSGTGTPTSPKTFTFTAPSGASAVYTMKYTTYSIQTYFGCSNIVEYGSNGTTTANLVTEIDLPDWNQTSNPNSRYLFTYEDTPQHSGFKTARLASVTLPTGGTITYTYTAGNLTGSAVGSNDPIVCADGTAAGLQRAIYDGTNTHTWTYARNQVSGPQWTTTITDPTTPTASQTLIYFQKDSNTTNPTNNFYETQRQVYQGSTSGTLLRQWITCYNGNATGCTTTAVSSPITQRKVTDQYGSSGLQCQHNYYYNSVGGLTEQDDYDYGSGTYGALLRKTLITYASLPPNITAFKQTLTICNGTGSSSGCAGPSGGNTGTVVAQTNYNYDETPPPTATSGITQHTSVSGSRGNLTSVNYPVNGLTSHLTYYDTGVLNTSKDVNGATTTYNYSSANNAYCNWAFPTSISEPLSMSRSMSWNCTGGVPATATDENNQVTTYTWNDPDFWRPANVKFADGGETDWTYNSQTSTKTTTKMNSSQNIVATQLLDGLGRNKEQQLNSAPVSAVYQDTTYDSLGRLYTVSNPNRSTSDPTYGLTTYGYDALSRTKSVTLQDGSVTNASYTNNTITATDPAGKKRTSTLDSLGRLTQVTEDPSGFGYVTTYSHDALGDVTGVTQNGSRQRTFVYDALSRLTSETNPESGTVIYSYDASGHSGDLTSRVAPAPNQIGSSTVTTTYTYDLLHRLTLRSYSDGSTPTATFYYDEHTHGTWSMTNPVGRLTVAYAPTSSVDNSEVFSYDPMGRVILHAQAGALNYGQSQAYNVNYTYDFAGNLTSEAMNGWEFPSSGVTLSYAYNSASQPTSVTSNLVDSQHPATLATVDPSVGYYPAGELRKIAYGNGLTGATAFNKDLQPCRINLNSSATTLSTCTDAIPSGNLLDHNYGFNAGTSDNGNVASWTATGQQAFNRTYTYDTLNRLGTMSDSNSGQQCRGLSWTYDAWGNRTDQTNTAGTCPTFHQTVDTKNRLVGPPYLYDAAGNMSYDGTHRYTYDAENRITQVDSGTTASYAYMPEGRRTTKISGGSTRDYVYDLSNRVIAEMTSSGWQVGNVYLGGQMIAEYKNSTTYFVHQDHLGSTRLVSVYPWVSPSQSLVQNLDYFPYGELNSTNSGITTHEFTGDERDGTAQTETGLDHTQFRQYSSSMDRWMTPDPAGLAAVDLTNPQSWNRYAYVTNNPLIYVDPLGMTGVPPPPPGGGSPMCNIDGIDAPCSIIGPSGGGVAACPQNVCTGINQDGLPVQFIATLIGSGYGCQLSGAFSTQRSAGIAAVNCAIGVSSAYGVEYSGDIYSIDRNGMYSFTAVQGISGLSDYDPTNIPDQTEYAGWYHTHNPTNISVFNEVNEQFSGTDISFEGNLESVFFPTYLGTPSGRILMLDLTIPGQGQGCVLRGTAVSPMPPSSPLPGRPAIPVCH